MPTTEDRSDLTQKTFGVLALVILAGACLWIARPFLVPFTWATMIVISTWPALERVQSLMWGSRRMATAVMTIALLLIFITPALLTAGTILSSADQIVTWTRSIIAGGLPHTPSFVKSIPLVGERLDKAWEEAASSGPEGLAARIGPYAGQATLWFVHSAGGAGKIAVEVILTVILAAVLYSTGEKAAHGVIRFIRRLAGRRGEHAIILAAAAIRSVALGVVVTAIAQTILAGIGLAVSGIPAAGILTAFAFVLCIAQIGPGVVLFAATAWLFYTGSTLWGAVLLVWSLFVVVLDNVLRPFLIKRGANLPLPLIFAGVIGGMVAFGIVGIFIGPAILAVTHALLSDWVGQQDEEEAREPA